MSFATLVMPHLHVFALFRQFSLCVHETTCSMPFAQLSAVYAKSAYMQAGSIEITSAERHDACHQRPGSKPPLTAATMPSIVGRSLQKLGFDKDAITPLLAAAVNDVTAKEARSPGAATAAAGAGSSQANAAGAARSASSGSKAVLKAHGKAASNSVARRGDGGSQAFDAVDDIAGVQAVHKSPSKALATPAGFSGSTLARADAHAGRSKSPAASAAQQEVMPPVKSEPLEATQAVQDLQPSTIDARAVANGMLNALIKQATEGSGTATAVQADPDGSLQACTAEAASARLVALAFANVLAAHGEAPRPAAVDAAPAATTSVVSISDDSTSLARPDTGVLMHVIVRYGTQQHEPSPSPHALQAAAVVQLDFTKRPNILSLATDVGSLAACCHCIAATLICAGMQCNAHLSNKDIWGP